MLFIVLKYPIILLRSLLVNYNTNCYRFNMHKALPTIFSVDLEPLLKIQKLVSLICDKVASKSTTLKIGISTKVTVFF